MRNRKFAIACSCAIVAILITGYILVRWQVRTSVPDTLRQAELHLRNGDYAAARDVLGGLLWFDPSHPRALLIVGISLNADRMFTESVAMLEQIPVESPIYKDAGTALVSSLIHDGQQQRAETELRQYLSRFPKSTQPREDLLRLYLSQLRKRAAVAVLQDYRRRYPDDLSVLPHMLDLEAKIVTAQDRVQALETADSRHPGQASVVLALARAYAQMGITEKARTRFQAALELTTDDPLTRILAAEFHFDSGDIDTARRLLRLDSGTLPQEAVADDRYPFLLCRMAAQADDISGAYAHLQQAMALRHSDETYVMMQSALLRQMGRVEEAATAGQEAAQLAETRKRLMVLSDELDRRQPASAHCLEIAELLQRLGHAGQAGDWRRVAGAGAVVP